MIHYGNLLIYYGMFMISIVHEIIHVEYKYI